jgi:hypothetical protein
MRKIVIFIILTLLVWSIKAQTGLYVGMENGPKWDRFHYINSKGFVLNKTSCIPMWGLWGCYIGYKLDRYTLETGFYTYYTRVNDIDYDYNTGKVSKSMSSFHASNLDNYVIPLRFGTEFSMWKKRFFIKPEIGLIGLIARTYSQTQPSVMGFYKPLGDSINPNTTDSTFSFGYRTSKFNLGIESSVCAGFRIIGRIDIYLKVSVSNSFKPLYYETITHYSSTQNVTATNTFNGNSVFVQIGLRAYWKKRKTE